MTVSYDKDTRKFQVTEEKPKKAKGKQPYSPRVVIRGEILTTLLGFAREDGFKLVRTNKQGKQVEDRGKVAKAITFFVLEAVREFISARAGK